MMQLVLSILDDIATLLDLSNSNRFKSKAIRKAIHTLESVGGNIEDLVATQSLKTLPGIGSSIANIITEIVNTGTSTYWERLRHIIPLSMAPLLKITGLKRYEILRLHERLKIESLDDLLMCTEQKLLELGISIRRQQRIRQNAKKYLQQGPQLFWWTAKGVAQFLQEQITKCPQVIRCELSGQLRRCCNTVQYIDFVIETPQPSQTFDWLAERPWARNIIKRTSTIFEFLSSSGIPIKITAAKNSFAKSLFITTGSAAHVKAFNSSLRTQGIAKTVNHLNLDTLDTEGQIYKIAGLECIPPELRENLGEILAAHSKNIPKLVEARDIKGIYHCHTVDSDGVNTFMELAHAAYQHYGWSYIGISDHSKSCTIGHGIHEEKLLAQIHAIREFNNSRICSCQVLSGIECDILVDGSLDFSDDILKQLDFVIVSIHSNFNASSSSMTRRLIKAIENPYTTIVGHVTGRLLLHRSPYKLDLNKVIDACIANKKIMEINGQPSRLDMDWQYWHRAADRGLLCAINPDAHSIKELRYYEAGVNVARKGWLCAEQIVNTRTQPYRNPHSRSET